MTVPINHAIRFAEGEGKPGDPITLRIERLPLSLNLWTRKFWTTRTRDLEDTKRHVMLAVGVKRRQWTMLNGPWFTGPVSVHLVYVVGRRVRRVGTANTAPKARGKFIDTDNLVPKHIIDALRGFAFADDGPEQIPLVSMETRIVEGIADYTIITVAPYSASVW